MVLILIPDVVPEPGIRKIPRDLNLRDLFIVPRQMWSKLPPLGGAEPLTHPTVNVIVSWTGQQPCETEEECVRAVWDLQKQYREKGTDIPYNFVVGGDANVYECRGWHEKPARCDRHPKLDGLSIEVAHIGCKTEDGQRPHTGMAFSAWKLCEYGAKKGYLIERPHFRPDYDIMYGTELNQKQINYIQKMVDEGITDEGGNADFEDEEEKEEGEKENEEDAEWRRAMKKEFEFL